MIHKYLKIVIINKSYLSSRIRKCNYVFLSYYKVSSFIASLNKYSNYKYCNILTDKCSKL